MNAKDKVCAEIQEIMRTYREQEASPSGVDTPVGWSTWATYGDYCDGGTLNLASHRKIILNPSYRQPPKGLGVLYIVPNSYVRRLPQPACPIRQRVHVPAERRQRQTALA